ncbi:MAG: hypothetical protein KJ949_01865, partial [Nanoarchaeota archaeon]|nr:hypothetical protein [Nanoarchaeota archaeon]
EEPLEEPIEEPVVEPEEPVLEPEAESQEEQTPEPEITGNVIFGFFQTLINRFRMPEMAITGHAVDEGVDDVVDDGGYSGGDEPGPDSGPGPEPDNDCADKYKACGGSCPPCDYDQGTGDGNFNDGNFNDNSKEFEERDNQEKQNNEKENRERCKQECARPCVDKCIREACGEQMDCNIDKESKNCESGCSADDNCISKCMEGGDWWKEFENEDMNKQEKGVFQVGGGCRTEQGRTEGYVWFGGWGEPFEQVEPLKQKYYEGGQGDWCEYEIENLIKQRQEFEKGFNQEFAVWFFEKYLPNSAENWEQSVSGIFELYWSNVDNQMMLANTMKCLEKNDLTELMNVNLINIEYETDYGKLKYWEEIKEVKMPGMDEKVVIVSPYMSVWVFPPKEFVIYEMKTAMENHEFLGSPEEKMERKNQGGLTEEQKQEVRNDEKAMERIRWATETYGGSLDFVVQFKDYETNEIVFNMYAKINEQVIMEITPMLPSEVEQIDATVEMDFKLFYDMIFVSEKDMMGDHIESPPWDKQMRPVQKIKEIGNGVKMWNKMRQLKNSAIITPNDVEKEVEKFAEWVIENAMMGGPDGLGGSKEEMKIKEGEEGKSGEEGGKIEFDKGVSGKVVWVSW